MSQPGSEACIAFVGELANVCAAEALRKSVRLMVPVSAALFLVCPNVVIVNFFSSLLLDGVFSNALGGRASISCLGRSFQPLICR